MLSDFSQQENFRNAWQLTEGQWDEDFMHFMNNLMLK